MNVNVVPLNVSSTDAQVGDTCINYREVDDRLRDLLYSVVSVKSKKKDEIDEKRKTLFGRLDFGSCDGDGALAAGDLANMGYLALSGTGFFFPKVASISAVQWTLMVLGLLGGLINIVVGVFCLIQGVRELRKKHRLDGLRLLFDGVLMIIVGIVMIAGPLLAKFLPGTVVTMIITHPIVLAVLFFLLSIFISFEVLRKLAPIALRTDVGSRLLKEFQKLEGDITVGECEDQINKILEKFFYTTLKKEGEETVPCSISNLRRLIGIGDEHTSKILLCSHMDSLEGDIGLVMAIEAFQYVVSCLQLSEAIYSANLEKEAKLKDAFGSEDGIDYPTRLTVNQINCYNDAHTQQVGGDSDLDVLSLTVEDGGSWQCPCASKHLNLCSTNAAKERGRQILQSIMEKNASLRKSYRSWVRDLCLRGLQEVAEIIASIVSVIGFAALVGRAAQIVNGAVCALLWLGNFIPLILDLWMPYTRNVPISIGGVAPEEVGSYSSRSEGDGPAPPDMGDLEAAG